MFDYTYIYKCFMNIYINVNCMFFGVARGTRTKADTLFDETCFTTHVNTRLYLVSDCNCLC